MRWSDASKTKSVDLVDSNKIDRSTGAVIQNPDIIMDLFSRVLIPYSSQRRGVKWYRKIAELYLDISVYNSFILWKKMNPNKQNVDHLNYRKLLVQEIIMFHAFGGQSQSTRPNPDTTKPNLIKLTNNKARAQKKKKKKKNALTARNLAFAKTHVFDASRVV